ncbi:MAG: SDR family NAD(P)-dependent oxidoreductase, partial [Anaerolineales bacterium]|nr:SDR family NAD(P)-dependent oxidoreductase [Anaerolineales bacterium]
LVPPQQTLTGSILHLVQAVAQSGADTRLWLVTRGAQQVDNSETILAPEQAPIWGIGHTIAQEYPNLHCVRVDLEPGSTTEHVPQLFDALRAPDDEDRIAFRASSRYVARLVRSVETAVDKMPLPDEPFMLDITDRGVLDNLYFKPAPRRAPEPGEVEIRVRATGLNFRDVLKGLGMYPGPLGPFGDECAGDVVAVGEGVTHLQVGDAVFGMAQGSFARYVTTTADFVVRKPDNISYADAATIPVTFLTAYYALHHVGQMQPGERALIHAASGGVGMAATQLARRAGVEVFGTASPRKWDVVRQMGVRHIMNSRTLDFSEQILEKTHGEGVHLVLNSLNGDFIPKSLAAMAPDGRFMEIGKVGIWSAAEVAEVRPEALYDVVFLDDVRLEEPALVRHMLHEIVAALADGSLKPLRHHLFPIEEVGDAFRFMAHAKHIGKIVVTQPADGAADAPLLHDNAAYLVTGGLGGLGLTVAQWMAAQGARHLVLVGRSAPSETAQGVLADLAAAGVDVHVARGDISQEADVQRILDDVNEALPPLRGIIHAAGVLDDGIISEQNWSRFARVMAPKVDGAHLLHALTRNVPLDFFVLFSSITSVLGSAGQANYVAANAYMDTLAAQRQMHGLPALSISW